MSNNNSVDDLLKSIDELTIQVTTYRNNKKFLNNKAEKWAKKRNLLNTEYKKVKNEINDLRAKIDRLNRKTNRLNEKRDDISVQIHTKNLEYINSKAKLQKLLRKTFMRKKETEQQIKNLEWKIQTNALTDIDEAKTIEKLKALELQFLIHKTASKIKRNIIRVKLDIKALKSRDNEFQNEVFEYNILRKKHRNNMVEKLQKKETIKATADQAHQKYVGYQKQAQIIHRKYSKIVERINETRNEIKKLQETKRKEREAKNMEVLSEAAYKKLRDNKKLSFEEFQVLMKKGQFFTEEKA